MVPRLEFVQRIAFPSVLVVPRTKQNVQEAKRDVLSLTPAPDSLKYVTEWAAYNRVVTVRIQRGYTGVISLARIVREQS